MDLSDVILPLMGCSYHLHNSSIQINSCIDRCYKPDTITSTPYQPTSTQPPQPFQTTSISMSSNQQDSFDHYLLDEIPETEQFMRDLANGQNIVEISNRTGVPRWQISLRIARFGLDCLDLAVFRSKERLGPHCHGVDEFDIEQSKNVVLATMAHMMTGTSLVGSLIAAQCNEAKAIEREKEKAEDSDDVSDSLSSWTFSEGRDNEGAKAKTGKGNEKGEGKKQPSKDRGD